MTYEPKPKPEPEPGSRFEAVPEAAPIACSLDAATLGERAGEWRSLVVWSVATVEVSALAVRLVLRDAEADLTAAVALAQREKHCCPFFDVSLELDSDRRTLVLAVPEGAEETLAAFVALLGP